MTPPEPDAALILDRLPVSVARVDADLRVRYANRRLCEVMGRTPAEVVGRECLELGMTPELWGHWAEAVRRVFATGEAGRFEFRATHGDGAGRVVRYQLVPEPGAGGGVETVLVLAHTDEADGPGAALAEQNALFAAFMDRGPMAAWLRNDRDEYVYVNAAYLRQAGASAEAVLGSTPAARFPADIAARFAANDAAVRRAGRALQFTEQAPRPDGTLGTWLSVKFPYAAADGRRFVGGVGVEVTEQVRLEHERRELERHLAGAQRHESLGVLAGGVAHEFNNLLTAILGNASLARLQLGPASPAAEGLRQIELASQRAARLCQQLLAYAGRGQPTMTARDLSGVVRDAQASLEATAPDGEFAFRLADGLPPVCADAGHLHQALHNLVANAAEALGPAGGRVTVSTGEADPGPGGRRVYIEVADGGHGMDEATRARAFEPFFSTRFTGRGLGLAAVKGIADDHRAEVEVRTAPGAGSTFRLTFPAVGPAEAAPGADIGRGRTLVVLDRDWEAAREALGQAGFRALVAPTPAEALAALRAAPDVIAAVLVDPGFAGPEVDAQLRGVRATLPVILVTALDRDEATRLLAKGPPAGYLRKPYTPAALAALLSEVVGP